MRGLYKPSGLDQRGFTILELMIATTVMSTILLIGTAVFTHLGGDYVKAAQLANTQNAARNIMDNISRQLEFGSAAPLMHSASNNAGTATALGTPNAICIGKTRYSFVINNQEGSGTSSRSPHALWQDSQLAAPADSSHCTALSVTSAGDPPPGSPAGTNGKELVPDRSRLTGLCVVPIDAASGTYQIDVWLAYGDDDLLGAPTGPADSCGDQHRYCIGGIGDQFCATSELETTVTRRVAAS